MFEKLKIDPIDLMNAAPRCGAKTRAGTPCRCPALRGKKRCKIHGGKSPGPPKGSQNALKHGLYTATAIEERRRVREALLELKAFLVNIE